MKDQRPLIAHIIYRLDVGGLENGLVNIINGLPEDEFRHVIICLKDFTDFRQRIHRKDVECIALNRKDGKDFRVYLRLWRILRQLRPSIVHTRNLPALDMVVPAFLAGVPVRIHSEHGRDVIDVDGSNKKYKVLRRCLSPFIKKFIALSADLTDWLAKDVGIREDKIKQICNGVDTKKFYPSDVATLTSKTSDECFFKEDNLIVIGTVGRMEIIKDTLNLVRAFIDLVRRDETYSSNIRLLLVGDGSLMPEVNKQLVSEGLSSQACLPGSRDDVASILKSIDVFVLPSLGEGISNTILEAMATGLPIVATDVGGNSELVKHGNNGLIVPAADSHSLANAIEIILQDKKKLISMGQESRVLINQHYSIEKMIDSYHDLYSELCNG